jgi:hypothetical protein
MSTEIYFANNYRDMCEQYGTGAGFQFEFSCSRCQDTWRSPFEPYSGARLAGWLNRGVNAASGLFGRVGNEITNAAEGLAGQGWGSARDAAFERAIATAQSHFHRCARCTSYVCERCWNAAQGLCLTCSPDAAVEVTAAQQRGLTDMAAQRAYDAGQQRGQEFDVQTTRQLVCPQCHAETHGGRFCAACGHALAQPRACTACHAELPETAAFCPGCGQRV